MRSAPECPSKHEACLIYIIYIDMYTYMFMHIYSSPFYLATTQSQCPVVIGRIVVSALCVIVVSRFVCQQKVLKTFPGAGYLHSKDGIVLTMAFHDEFVYMYVYVYMLCPERYSI